jgi:branched-chain amino acid transport system ATP-binding protein
VTEGSLLSVQGLAVAYERIQAVREVSFEIRPGEIATLIGANGAGKSSILRAVSGMVPYRGTVRFGGKDLRRTPAERIVGLGVAHVPEGRGIFGNLTVLENLTLATWQRKERSGLTGDYERVFGIFPRLAERRNQQAGTLSGGEQQMLAVGRALMTRARLLLLDEPSMGLSPILVRDIFQVLVEINRAGTTLLLVEQNAHMALKIATSAHVLETGAIVLSGSGPELMGHARVKEAYLGG